MRTTHHIVWAAATVATVLSVSSMLTAGPLTPPPGPVASTPEIEPRTAVNAANTPGDDDGTPSLFKITQPGSYYLEGNVTGVAGRHGVEIAVGGVTLDLNGFELVGVPGSLTGVAVSAPVRNLRIHNGAVRGWGEQGVGAASALNAVLRDLVASDNTLSGLRIGDGGVVRGCAARDNGADGVFTGSGSTVTNSVSSNNADSGIFVGNGSIVRACVASFNGIIGIRIANGCHVVGNLCDNNSGPGVFVEGADNRIEGNHVTDSGTAGIFSNTSGNLIIRNSAEGNLLDYNVIISSHTIGPIVTGSGEITSTNPWANFSF